jgi:hypothetical protein
VHREIAFNLFMSIFPASPQPLSKGEGLELPIF